MAKLFLQDGNPSQNTKKASVVLEQVGETILAIPLKSLDMNPIENAFNYTIHTGTGSNHNL